MKFMRILALAAPLAALLALVAAGTSSATVLCSTAVNPCPTGQKVPAGTTGKGSLKPGTSGIITDTSGEVVDTCSGGTITGTLENPGSATETVREKGGFLNVTWEKCSFPMKTLQVGTVEVHHIAGTNNGTVTASGFETTINTVLFGSCTYTYGNGTDVGVVTGGNPATLDANEVLHRGAGSSFACPETVIARAEGLATEPANTPIYVEES